MAKPVKNLYELVPVQIRPFERMDDGTVDVLLPRYGGGPVARVLKSFLSNKPVRIRLDDVGTGVWDLCDGSRSVHEIGLHLHEAFGDRIEPVYDRLALFLEQMRQQGLIAWGEANGSLKRSGENKGVRS